MLIDGQFCERIRSFERRDQLFYGASEADVARCGVAQASELTEYSSSELYPRQQNITQLGPSCSVYNLTSPGLRESICFFTPHLVTATRLAYSGEQYAH